MPSTEKRAVGSEPPARASKTAARRILKALERHHPGADTELQYSTPFELLAATILSAQSTDVRVNEVTPELFRCYPDASALARARPETVERLIRTTGFFRSKTRALLGMADALVERHDGEVPASMDDLVKLPGVGRKTANVVLGHAFGIPGFPVDRHVLRVARRLGLIATDDPVKAEALLCQLLPRARWTVASDSLILHGRRICRPRPLCDRCGARSDCAYAADPTAVEPPRPPAARPR